MEPSVKLLVGLGNPGPKYETTRHNAGFLMVDLLAEEAGLRWEDSLGKFKALVARGTVLGTPCLLLKPMTFMNLSGRSVGPVLSFYKIEPAAMVVLYDDVDVPAGKVKARIGGGHGGHNGVRSIIEVTGQSDFHRVKLGLGRPPEGWDTADWVLGGMTTAELGELKEAMLADTKVRLTQIFQGNKGA